jgi:hypothetical protein
MAQAHEPEVVAARSYAQPEARKLSVPDAVFAFAQRQLAAGKIAIEKCSMGRPSAFGDHMAFALMQTAPRTLGNTVICGDRAAFNSALSAEHLERFTH